MLVIWPLEKNYKMKTLGILVILLFGLNQFAAKAQSVTMIISSQILEWKSNTSDTIYVINFFATWCKPCIAEIPEFEKLGLAYQGKKVKIILVSNDFKNQIETKLVPFIKKNIASNQVVFMDENNPNKWINLVDENWSGAIPATLIIRGSSAYSKFYEGEVDYKILNEIVLSLNP